MSDASRWKAPVEIRRLIDVELRTSRTSDDPWPALETAHLLSQPWWWPHTQVHGAMLAVAVRNRDRREALGQIIRILVAGPGSLAGRYPTGNTGRTTMALTEAAPVPVEIEAELARHLRSRPRRQMTSSDGNMTANWSEPVTRLRIGSSGHQRVPIISKYRGNRG